MRLIAATLYGYLSIRKPGTNTQGGVQLLLSHQPLTTKKLAILCPITSHQKGYPFEVVIPPGLKVIGVVLSDQIKSLDWKIREAEFICKLPEAVVTESLKKNSEH